MSPGQDVLSEIGAGVAMAQRLRGEGQPTVDGQPGALVGVVFVVVGGRRLVDCVVGGAAPR
jgi:hypothetical protein